MFYYFLYEQTDSDIIHNKQTECNFIDFTFSVYFIFEIPFTICMLQLFSTFLHHIFNISTNDYIIDMNSYLGLETGFLHFFVRFSWNFFSQFFFFVKIGKRWNVQYLTNSCINFIFFSFTRWLDFRFRISWCLVPISIWNHRLSCISNEK